ncbi:uncharacterized protein LOC141824096 [Curcuma longa]|uniref:uncharacterized protein LOC141824096 n=1 Tax=Curcuma longa TaxID=136217 RepID=UPI003D9E8FD8
MGSYSFERATDQSPFWILPSPSSEEARMGEEAEQSSVEAPEEVEEGEDVQWGCGWREEEPWPRRSGGGVTLEGYLDAGDGGEGADGVLRTKSLTDEDLEELKGCLDLGFGFNYEEIPELYNTLPALELCYSMSQRFLDEQQQNRSLDRSSSGESMDLCPSATPPPIANWKISSPGDDPDEVKARLKYWAQTVACTIRLCN